MGLVDAVKAKGRKVVPSEGGSWPSVAAGHPLQKRNPRAPTARKGPYGMGVNRPSRLRLATSSPARLPSAALLKSTQGRD
jgi:hypothetical protein